MADDGRTKATGITGGHAAGEKYPRVSAITGSRNLQCCWHTQILTGLHERTCIVSPIGPVKVGRQKIAGVIFQKRVDADRVLASQMVIDHRIRQRDQQAVAAIAALDARLLANSRTPLVCTGGGVA